VRLFPAGHPRYCVGIRSDVDKGTFSFPTPLPFPPSLEDVLDTRDPLLADCGEAHPKNAANNVLWTEWRLARLGHQFKEQPFVVDCDAGSQKATFSFNVCPCLICARSEGHWLTNRGRRTRLTEMLRLQGHNPRRFRCAVSARQLGKQIGNAMSVNILERIYCSLLPACGLVSGTIPDPWLDGRAIARLRESIDAPLLVTRAVFVGFAMKEYPIQAV
jgi:hypothetical protein